MSLVGVITVQGDHIYINPDHVMSLRPVKVRADGQTPRPPSVYATIPPGPEPELVPATEIRMAATVFGTRFGPAQLLKTFESIDVLAERLSE